jgi:hypothetical protein
MQKLDTRRLHEVRHPLLQSAIALATMAVCAVLLTGCGGGEGNDTERTGATTSLRATSTEVAAVEPLLVGEWQRATTCAELVRALKQAGLEKFAPEAVAGNGFVPGVTTADQLADPARPCDGAVPRRHSHFFTDDGEFGSLDWNGEPVDDGTYEIIDDRTFIISKEFPDVTFHYRIDGDTITFEPVIPDDCSTFRCMWSVSVAYPGKSWKRVS